MKYDHTEHINIKRHPETGVYYFKRGAIEESLRTKDWKDAKARVAVKIIQLEAAGTAAATLIVEDLASQYRADRYADPDLSEGTLREMDYIFSRHLLPHFGSKKLIDITSGAWKKYCDKKRGLDLSNHRKTLWGLLKWCQDQDFIAAMPNISRIPRYSRRKRRIIKPAELREIFTHADGSLRVFLTLALYNGLRRKEIMTLKWKNISLDEKYLAIEKQDNKRRRSRSIPFNDIVLSVLTARRKSVKGSWVFPHALDPKRHADLGGLKTAWRTCLKRAGLEDITWHDFRATYEKHLHKSTEHTDMQKEKFADATMEVQKRIYVSMDHEDLRGLETVVQVEGLESLIMTRGERGDQND